MIAGHDLAGKTALVTGASSGLGVETARALLSAHAEVILAVRDTAKGERVAQQLRVATGNAQVHVLSLDLGPLASIRLAAEQLRARRSNVDFDDIHYHHRPYDKWGAYGQSKTANALFAVGLTQQVGNRGITANAINPGAIFTGLQQNLSPEDLRAIGWIDEEGQRTTLLDWKTPKQGAATSVWAAVGHELEGIGGRYLEDCQEAAPFETGMPRGHGYLPYALDPEHAERLWTLSQDLIGWQG